jgi:hypothetical protein
MEFLYAFEVEALTLEAGLLILLCLALAAIATFVAVAPRRRVPKVAWRVGHEEALAGLMQAA